MATPIPQGYRTVTPSMTFKDCRRAIEHYKKAFGAEEVEAFEDPESKKIVHAEIKIGDSILMLSDENEWTGKSAETLRASPVKFYVYVPDCDKAYQKAIGAGCQSVMEVKDQFWGDRLGAVKDPFGYSWSLATHREDVSPEEMKARGKRALEEMRKETHAAA